MDFGFDGFLDKFEQHFGKGLTKALLILIGLAVASVCLAVIWRYLFSPVLAFFQAPGNLEVVAKITTTGAAIMSGALLALRIYDWHLGRKLNSRARSRAELDAQIKATEAVLETLDKRAAERRERRDERG